MTGDDYRDNEIAYSAFTSSNEEDGNVGYEVSHINPAVSAAINFPRILGPASYPPACSLRPRTGLPFAASAPSALPPAPCLGAPGLAFCSPASDQPSRSSVFALHQLSWQDKGSTAPTLPVSSVSPKQLQTQQIPGAGAGPELTAPGVKWRGQHSPLRFHTTGSNPLCSVPGSISVALRRGRRAGEQDRPPKHRPFTSLPPKLNDRIHFQQWFSMTVILKEVTNVVEQVFPTRFVMPKPSSVIRIGIPQCVVTHKNVTWDKIDSSHASEPIKRKWEAKLKQIEERASYYKRKPLSSVYRPRLSKPEEPPSIWKLFHRQTQAFNFVKSCKEDVHVFALEYKEGDGQRIYLVTTYAQLWFYYKSRKNLLHCYEIIPESSVCKLYFDLEFNKLANPGADGKKMVASLIEHVCKALQEVYSVNCSAEDVFNLDSSTDEKFSRHLIFQLHDVAFKDNIHVVFDVGVYTRNRNFRLYKSSKIGKHVALEVAEDNKFFPTQSKNISKENQYFLSSLVSNVRFSDTLRILTCDTSQDKQKHVEYFNHSNISVETIEGFQCSPYPEIDRFVCSLVNKNGIQGGIRRWNYFFPEELLVYDICKYRWCENIGRAHKSNNIMILVDLKNEVWYQKCHDPVCKAENFKSDCFPLPPEVGLLMLFKDEEEFTTDETRNNEIKLSRGDSSHDDWDNSIDDADFSEAVEDAELAEATANSLLSYSSGVDEIPDELILEVLQ
ncbi:DNA-directed primase/polymerase protein [Orycteropus afer afer]|uniref:DNA-directed primase/polymerase protein n=1 Tax=Orycteropus afer afer TaxID=1230840 RepID=A0A8B6ZTQ7_ORYAF|nr:DNA-directed primase/polymerase protein [Orycteropus afer afer]